MQQPSEAGRGAEGEGATKPVPSRSGEPVSDANESAAAPQEADLEQRIAVMVESRVLSVIRRETGDPYAGLPADDVLVRLDQRFPEVNFPERMMRRLEVEQAHRHDMERAESDQAAYDLESARLANTGVREEQGKAGQRAERVLYVLIAVGLVLIFAGYPAIGGTLLGTTLVAVVGSFLQQRARK